MTTFLGIAVALASVLASQMLDGGHLHAMVQSTAAVIVLGGTAGAIVTQFPLRELRNGLLQTRWALLDPRTDLSELVTHLVTLARRSRREGLLALEDEALESEDSFLRMGLLTLVDGTDPVQLRALLDTQLAQEMQIQDSGPRLLEAAGGYAPTLGILGAVLGLIHVMENLSDTTRLGSGIAVAFVATVYGIASANLIFLPLAQKLRIKLQRENLRREMILEAVCGIQEGLNPLLLERRLLTFCPERSVTASVNPPAWEPAPAETR